MKLFVDGTLSPDVSSALLSAGHIAVHAEDVSMEDAAAEDVLAYARMKQLVVITADSNAKQFLEESGFGRPSVVRVDTQSLPDAESQASRLIEALKNVAPGFLAGAILTVTADDLEQTPLPLP